MEPSGARALARRSRCHGDGQELQQLLPSGTSGYDDSQDSESEDSPLLRGSARDLRVEDEETGCCQPEPP
ncbi:Protein SLFN14 [Frankliniella fusca]|uniref:Protein SLFN14 n=1 Tax=Frankliniella fusca TaxID=407009 RepID=A0AAE1HHK5_9NEOP|nr:Protein SLFN14 [Frankliniella fusca]